MKPLKATLFQWSGSVGGHLNWSFPDQGGSCKRSCGESQILLYIPAVPSSTCIPLFHLQQLCPEIWSPLSLGWPMHWYTKLQVLLLVYHDVNDLMLLCFRGFLDQHYSGTWTPRLESHVTWYTISSPDRLLFHYCVVRWRPFNLPPFNLPLLPDEHKSDDVWEFQVPIWQEWESIQPRDCQELNGCLLFQNPTFHAWFPSIRWGWWDRHNGEYRS